MTNLKSKTIETLPTGFDKVQRYSCFRVGEEIGMVEDSNGAWVPAFDYLRLLTRYQELKQHEEAKR